MSKRTLAVIGGGAAGFFCAVNAAAMDPSLRVLIIERSGKLLSKVRVSGGGRCNVTHDCDDITEMSSRYPRGKNFVKRSFHGFFTVDTLSWFRKRGVELKVEADGRMFPVSNSSETIIRCLLDEADAHGVEILMNTVVDKVDPVDGGFDLVLKKGGNEEHHKVDLLCIATGGYPKLEQYNWMSVFGHTINRPVPSLFTFNAPGNKITELMGVSVPDAEVRLTEFKFRDHGPLLITHWGLSGPVVLRASAWCARELEEKLYKATVTINWCAGKNDQQVREILRFYREGHGALKVRARSPLPLPLRLWDHLADLSGIKDQKWGELPSSSQNKLVDNICNFSVSIEGKTTFKEEFVTAGGIALSEVDPATMQSKKIEGLYFAGEVLDVDGITGGYNFQHAWTSGYNAARHIAGKSLN